MARSRPRVIIRSTVRHGEARLLNMSKKHRANMGRSIERQTILDERDRNRAIRDAENWATRKRRAQ